MIIHESGMEKSPSAEDIEGSDLYPIRTVSDLTGVNAITLRAWERRYGFFEPVRKASGHRLYTQKHIDLITRVVGLLEHGMRIGQVKAKLDAEDALAEKDQSGIGDLWNRYLERMTAAVIQFDESRLEAVYCEALSLYSVHMVTEKLVTPLLRELGRRWEEGQGSVAEEHFFGFYLRNKLGARFHHRSKQQGGTKLLLACLPGDRHETGLLLFALVASDAGYQTILLGADMPISDLAAAAKKTGSKAIVLSGMVRPPSGVIDRDLAGLKLDTEVPVFVGGKASTIAHDALKKAGIVPLGTDLKTGLQRVRDVLSA